MNAAALHAIRPLLAPRAWLRSAVTHCRFHELDTASCAALFGLASAAPLGLAPGRRRLPEEWQHALGALPGFTPHADLCGRVAPAPAWLAIEQNAPEPGLELRLQDNDGAPVGLQPDNRLFLRHALPRAQHSAPWLAATALVRGPAAHGTDGAPFHCWLEFLRLPDEKSFFQPTASEALRLRDGATLHIWHFAPQPAAGTPDRFDLFLEFRGPYLDHVLAGLAIIAG